MKTTNRMIFYFLFIFLISIVGCGENDENGKAVPDPVGTVLVNMRNSNSGNTEVHPAGVPTGVGYGFVIGSDNNFRSYYINSDRWKFVNVGEIKGLGNITKIPSDNWANSTAVMPEYGYVARVDNGSNSKTYVRIYVSDWILGSNKAILGAVVKYQSPFEPEDD